MLVRVGKLEDIEAILAIERSAPEAPHWPSQEYRKALEPAAGAVHRKLFVCETPEGLLGFAVGTVLDAGGQCEGELENLAVREEARRQGIGLALCTAVFSWCQEQAAKEVALEVRASSAGAIRLYEKLGFQKIGERRAYYREPLDDAILMRWLMS
ncbi:ribosomal protein S18-alanine N-acetyltransferase [Granulicella sibirica]|uniref:[Ribosomal protein bS18]-alanine N-acetyltransferase n=1 Tax=Granulicella sibirica TaxID=2479048 RepID=A0A4Q0T2S2_9BACT|nr:ribosomal protein S18-alanine N-acetyltransferase [Granulicella sibirica]RXH56730.1 Ribosomal-protein-S18p-alanine acetyltransferase [Granulicella sibirica]